MRLSNQETEVFMSSEYIFVTNYFVKFDIPTKT